MWQAAGAVPSEATVLSKCFMLKHGARAPGFSGYPLAFRPFLAWPAGGGILTDARNAEFFVTVADCGRDKASRQMSVTITRYRR